MSATVPISMPDDLLQAIRAAAQATALSQQDVMRQSMKAGLPAVVEKFSVEKPAKRIVATLVKEGRHWIFATPVPLEETAIAEAVAEERQSR